MIPTVEGEKRFRRYLLPKARRKHCILGFGGADQDLERRWLSCGDWSREGPGDEDGRALRRGCVVRGVAEAQDAGVDRERGKKGRNKMNTGKAIQVGSGRVDGLEGEMEIW